MATKKSILIIALLLFSMAGSIFMSNPANAAIYTFTRTHSMLGTWTTTANQQAGTLTWTPASSGYSLVCVILAKGSASTPSVVSITQSGVTWVEAVSKTYTSNLQYEGIFLGTITGAVSTSYTITANNADGISSSFLEYDCVLATDKTASTAWDTSSPFVSGTTATVATNQQVQIAGFGLYGSTAPPVSSIQNGFSAVDQTDNGLFVNVVLEKLTAYDTTPAAASTGCALAGMYGIACIATFQITSVPLYYSYNLKSQYEDGTTLASLAVNAADNYSSFAVTVTSTATTYYFTYPITAFTWVTGSYTRTYHPLASGETYIFYVPAGGSTSRVHLWTIRDLVGAASKGYLETRRVVGSTEYVIERRLIIDTINGIPVVMIDGAVYHVYVLESDKTTYHEFGYYLATSSDTEPTLTLAELAYDQKIRYVTTEIPVVVTRSVDKTEIELTYSNNQSPDYNLTTTYLVIKNRAGATVYTANSTAQSDTFTKTGLSNSTDYVVYFTSTSDYFGAIQGTWAFEGFKSYATVPSLGDVGFTFGGIEGDDVLGVAALVFVAGIFSAGTAPLGAVVVVLMAGIEARLGFITVTDAILGLCMCLAVMYAISKRGGMSR